MISHAVQRARLIWGITQPKHSYHPLIDARHLIWFQKISITSYTLSRNVTCNWRSAAKNHGRQHFFPRLDWFSSC